MKISVILKPCPWCKRTPELKTPLTEHSGGTWIWFIQCETYGCVNPVSKSISIRKTTKTDAVRLAKKLDELACGWNQDNDYKAYEKKELDITPLVSATTLVRHRLGEAYKKGYDSWVNDWEK